jgi:molybdopterin converting factor small subunit
LFGSLRLAAGLGELNVEAETVAEMLAVVATRCPDVTENEIRRSAIFVNGKSIAELTGFRTKLKAGDEVLLMSPAGGG